MSRTVPTRVSFLLFLLFFLGSMLAVLSFVDLHWTHWLLIRAAQAADPPEAGAAAAPADDGRIAQLRQSLVAVHAAQCGRSGESIGSGFVVKAGYVATAAHLLGDEQSCGGRIRLIDVGGREHPAALEALSGHDDLALLRISDRTLPPLPLADSVPFESSAGPVPLAMIGAPRGQAGAASPNVATASFGSLSRFDREHGVFVTAGLDPGEEGGPVFLRESWQVLGVARAKPSASAADGTGLVVPNRTVINFFREKTGQELR